MPTSISPATASFGLAHPSGFRSGDKLLNLRKASLGARLAFIFPIPRFAYGLSWREHWLLCRSDFLTAAPAVVPVAELGLQPVEVHVVNRRDVERNEL